MCHKFFFIFLPCRLLPDLAAMSLVDLPFLNFCRALHFFQSKLNVLALCSKLKWNVWYQQKLKKQTSDMN